MQVEGGETITPYFLIRIIGKEPENFASWAILRDITYGGRVLMGLQAQYNRACAHGSGKMRQTRKMWFLCMIPLRDPSVWSLWREHTWFSHRPCYHGLPLRKVEQISKFEPFIFKALYLCMRCIKFSLEIKQALKISWIMRRERCLDAIHLSAKLLKPALNRI